MSLLGSAKFDSQKGTFADEDFSNLKELLIIGHPKQNVAGKELPFPSYLAIPPQRHFLSIAPTRSGKGTTLIIPNLLNYAGSCIVIDPKGENAFLTAKRRRDMGQRVYILDPWNEVNRRYGDLAGEREEISCFNPLSILDPASDHYTDDLAYLADALIITESKDPFFDDSARDLMAGLMAYCVETVGKDAATLAMVRMHLTKSASEVAATAKNAQKLNAESAACRKLGRFAEESRTNDSIISTALTQTIFLDSKPLGESLSSSDFAFDDLTTGEPTTIYLVLPVDKLQTHGRWLRLMISIAIRTVARNAKPLPLPVLFLLDEFGTIGRLSAIAQAYGLMSGLQMCIWAFIQDLVQLRRDYSQDWETFISNAEAVTFFQIMDHFTADYVSKLLGKITVWHKDTRDNQHPHSRDLVQTAEVRAETEAGFLVVRGYPLRYAPEPYFHNDFFRSVARPNPYYQGQESTGNLSPVLETLTAERRAYWQDRLQRQARDTFSPYYKRKGLALFYLRLIGAKIWAVHGFISVKMPPNYLGGKHLHFFFRSSFLKWMMDFYKGHGMFFEQVEEENNHFMSLFTKESMVAFRDDNGKLSQWIPID